MLPESFSASHVVGGRGRQGRRSEKASWSPEVWVLVTPATRMLFTPRSAGERPHSELLESIKPTRRGMHHSSAIEAAHMS